MIEFIKKKFLENAALRHMYWRFKHLKEPEWAKKYFDDKSLNDGRNRIKLIQFHIYCALTKYIWRKRSNQKLYWY